MEGRCEERVKCTAAVERLAAVAQHSDTAPLYALHDLTIDSFMRHRFNIATLPAFVCFLGGRLLNLATGFSSFDDIRRFTDTSQALGRAGQFPPAEARLGAPIVASGGKSKYQLLDTLARVADSNAEASSSGAGDGEAKASRPPSAAAATTQPRAAAAPLARSVSRSSSALGAVCVLLCLVGQAFAYVWLFSMRYCIC